MDTESANNSISYVDNLFLHNRLQDILVRLRQQEHNLLVAEAKLKQAEENLKLITDIKIFVKVFVYLATSLTALSGLYYFIRSIFFDQQ